MWTIVFGDLNQDFTFSPLSPISPCWERKQSIRDKKAEEVGLSWGVIAVTEGQIVSGVKFMLDYRNSFVLAAFPQTIKYRNFKCIFILHSIIQRKVNDNRLHFYRNLISVI